VSTLSKRANTLHPPAVPQRPPLILPGQFHRPTPTASHGACSPPDFGAEDTHTVFPLGNRSPTNRAPEADVIPTEQHQAAPGRSRPSDALNSLRCHTKRLRICKLFRNAKTEPIGESKGRTSKPLHRVFPPRRCNELTTLLRHHGCRRINTIAGIPSIPELAAKPVSRSPLVRWRHDPPRHEAARGFPITVSHNPAVADQASSRIGIHRESVPTTPSKGLLRPPAGPTRARPCSMRPCRPAVRPRRHSRGSTALLRRGSSATSFPAVFAQVVPV